MAASKAAQMASWKAYYLVVCLAALMGWLKADEKVDEKDNLMVG